MPKRIKIGDIHDQLNTIERLFQALVSRQRRLRKLFLNYRKQQIKDAKSDRLSKRHPKARDLSVDVAGFTIRILNVFEAQRIKTLGDLAKWSETELIECRGMGAVSIKMVIDILGLYGLKLDPKSQLRPRPSEDTWDDHSMIF